MCDRVNLVICATTNVKRQKMPLNVIFDNLKTQMGP